MDISNANLAILLDFLGSHPFLTWSALWLVWIVVPIVSKILSFYIRTLRLISILFRGWPPAHLDADGDHPPPPVIKKSEENSNRTS